MTIFYLLDGPVILPALQPAAAASVSSLLTLSYVGGLYVCTATRIGQARNKEGVLYTKNDKPIVKSRLRVASVSTLVSLLSTVSIVRQKAYPHEPRLLGTLAALRLVGIPLPAPSFLHSNFLPIQPSFILYTLHHILPSILLPLTLTSILFLGPNIVSALDGALPGQQHYRPIKQVLIEKLNNVWGIRNYLVGPITEEAVFRGCVLSLHALAGFKKMSLIFATPLYFGIGTSVSSCRSNTY